MKNSIKLFVGILIGIVICGISVYAAEEIINAKDIRYKTKTVEDSLNELYIKANAKDVGALKFCKFIDGTYGSFGQIGSKYECDPGDGVKRNFYLLSINNNNTVDLIMDRELVSNINWNDAMNYFRIGQGAQTKNLWVNILNIDLPKAQSITDAVGNSKFIAASANPSCYCLGNNELVTSCGNYKCSANNAQKEKAWLYNHLNNCEQYGCSNQNDSVASSYWTSDLLSGYNYAWVVNYSGNFNNTIKSNSIGLRPVITVLKSNLYSE